MNKLIIFMCMLVIGLTGCGLIHTVLDTICGIPPEELLTPEETSKVALYSKLNWLSVASIIGVAIAAAATVNGSRLAMPIFAGCVASLGVSLAVMEYAGFLAIGSLISAVCIFVYSIFIKNRVVKELINGAEGVKNFHFNDRKQVSKILFEHQTVPTRKIVNKIKDSLRLKGKL